jgi:alpha-glucoside transport system substrate-binding protein
MMLRTQPPDVYDKWVSNEVPFTDPRVIGAIEEFGYFARNDDFVAGGAGAVATTDFRDSPKGLFSSPPQCYMHHQASFIPAFFPEGTEIGTGRGFLLHARPMKARISAAGSGGRHIVGHHQ